MKLRKLFAMLLAGAMSLSLLAGCGSGDTPPAPSQGGTPDSSQAPEGSTPPEGGTEIVWAGWSGEEEASKAIFQRMMETYEKASGNSVTWVGWTWADTAQQLLIRTQGKEQLDLAQTDIGIFNTVAAAGVLADWNDILGKDFMDATFEQSALSVGNIDGKQLGMPWSMASRSSPPRAGTKSPPPSPNSSSAWPISRPPTPTWCPTPCPPRTPPAPATSCPGCGPSAAPSSTRTAAWR